jgi:hypothetical protein
MRPSGVAQMSSPSPSRQRRESAEEPLAIAPARCRYRFETGSTGIFRIVDDRAGTVDIVRSRSVADYIVRHLNLGTANVNPHAIVGCRVEVR